MTLTIEVSNEIESRIEIEARRNGVNKTDIVGELLRERFQADLALAPSDSNGHSQAVTTNLPVKDRSSEFVWLEQHRDEYDGKYVALNGSCLVAVGESYKEVATKAKEDGVDNALLVHVEGSQTLPSLGGIW